MLIIAGLRRDLSRLLVTPVMLHEVNNDEIKFAFFSGVFLVVKELLN